MRLDCHRLDKHALDAEVGELGLVDLILLVERGGDLVDDSVPPAFADCGLPQLGLVPMYVVVGQDLAYRVDARLDGGLVGGCRVLAAITPAAPRPSAPRLTREDQVP